MTAAEIIRKALAVQPWDLPAYGDFVCSMTSEGLHSKADIAQVFAFQEKQNTRLRRVLTHLVARVLSHNVVEDHETWQAVVDEAVAADKMLKDGDA